MLWFFHIGNEMIAPKPGFNFYPLSDKASFGFKFRYGNKLRFFRYSKTTKKFHFSKIVAGEKSSF